MRRIIATAEIGYPGCEVTEEFEFPDNTSDEEIEEYVEDWANNDAYEINCTWEEA